MISLVRQIISYIFLGVVFLLGRKGKILKTKKKYYITLITGFLLLSFPFETIFLSYASPENAFKYTQSGDIIEIVEQEKSAFVIYHANSGETSFALYEKHGDRWKVPIFNNNIDFINVPDIHNQTTIARENNSDNFYIKITFYENVESFSDNYNTNFTKYLENDWSTSYVAYVDDFKGEYLLTINGIQYEIPSVEDDK